MNGQEKKQKGRLSPSEIAKEYQRIYYQIKTKKNKEYQRKFRAVKICRKDRKFDHWYAKAINKASQEVANAAYYKWIFGEDWQEIVRERDQFIRDFFAL